MRKQTRKQIELSSVSVNVHHDIREVPRSNSKYLRVVGGRQRKRKTAMTFKILPACLSFNEFSICQYLLSYRVAKQTRFNHFGRNMCKVSHSKRKFSAAKSIVCAIKWFSRNIELANANLNFWTESLNSDCVNWIKLAIEKVTSRRFNRKLIATIICNSFESLDVQCLNRAKDAQKLMKFKY